MAVLAAVACTPEMEVSGEWGLCLDPAGVVTADSLLGERADSRTSRERGLRPWSRSMACPWKPAA